MSSRRFKKKYLPGPDSEEEKRDLEVEQMMTDWYGNTSADQEIILKKKSGWRIVLIIFILFILIAAIGLTCLGWVIEGRPLSFNGGKEEFTVPVVLDLTVPEKVNSGDTVTFIINP